MLDDSFSCWTSLKNSNRKLKGAMDASKLIRFCDLVVEIHAHTNVYAVYACGCSLSGLLSY